MVYSSIPYDNVYLSNDYLATNFDYLQMRGAEITPFTCYTLLFFVSVGYDLSEFDVYLSNIMRTVSWVIPQPIQEPNQRRI